VPIQRDPASPWERNPEFKGLFHVSAFDLAEWMGRPDLLQFPSRWLHAVDSGGHQRGDPGATPSVERYTTSLYLARTAAGRSPLSVRYRLRPAGSSELEYADEVTLARALARPRRMR